MADKLDRYYHYRGNIAPGDPITWEGDSLISRGIRVFTHRSHASSALGEVRAGEERKLIMEADQGEVNTRLLSEKLKDYSGRCYLHKLKPELEPYRPKIVEFLWSHLGVGYDYLSLFANILGLVSSNARQFFCSELSGASIWYPADRRADPETGRKGFRAPPGVPKQALLKYLPDPWLEKLLAGVALRPGGIALLPIYTAEIRIL